MPFNRGCFIDLGLYFDMHQGWIMRPFTQTNARVIRTMCVFNLIRPHLRVIFEGRGWGRFGGPVGHILPPQLPVTTTMHC